MTPNEITKARERIAESEKICKAATDGPWVLGGGGLRSDDGGLFLSMHHGRGFEDFTLIAHASAALPERNAELLAALTEIERLQKELMQWKDVKNP